MILIELAKVTLNVGINNYKRSVSSLSKMGERDKRYIVSIYSNLLEKH